MANTPFYEVFQKSYQQLNPQQKKAVDTIEGPVMVNAGPGTGKTQILATRIGKILLDTDTDPQNILCLTYTENGAVEMRNRLLKMIGAAAYRIHIHTYHSFCNEVIQDNSTYFGKLSLEPIGELEEIDLFYKLINGIDKDSPLKRFRGDVYYEKDRLKALFSLMKKEALTPAYFEERIDAHIAELPTKEGFYYKRKFKEFNAGDPKPAAIAEEKEKMELLRAAVNLYPLYNKMMADISRYNFDDMILWVLDAFEKNPLMLQSYQEKYLYFLVDEFQDTSRAQNLLIQQLTAYWDVPNLFVVGDADQSIFSFQDANVENIVEFEKRFLGNIEKVDLSHNYRSTQNILEVAYRLITQNSLRAVSPESDQPLLSANLQLADLAPDPQLAEYANPTQEAIDVALQIEALVNQGVSGKEIAVIYRNHAQVSLLSTVLEAKGIVLNTRRKVDLLQLPFVQNIRTILTWIEKESFIAYSADDLLFKLLHFDFFRLPPLEIARLSIAVNDKNRSSRSETYSLRRIIAEQAQPVRDLFSNSDNAFSVKSVSNALEELLKANGNVTLQQLFELVLQKAGILSYVMQSPEKPWLMQVLNTFFNFIKEETRRQPRLNLRGLLENMDKMESNRLPVSLNKINTAEEGIHLVTAHSSKGSEFSHVFVIGCTRPVWDAPSSGNNRNYKMPDNLVSSRYQANELEESRRLFYVAITRAKTHLYISWFVKDAKDKEVTRSAFVTEILERTSLQVQPRRVPEALMSDHLSLQFAEKARPEIRLVEDRYIDQILQRYTLSVTHLNNYLSCPLKFYYQNLIRVPSAKTGSLVFGSAVHFAVEMLFKKMQDNGNVFPPRETFLDDFKWYLRINREAFTAEEFARRNEYGEKILPAYYDYRINSWSKVVSIERNIRNIHLRGVPLNGKLDKLEFNGKLVNVVDYKTGKWENARKKLFPPDEKEPNGGDYWRQAVFYKILLDNDNNNGWITTSTEFEFVEPVGDEYKTEKVLITPEDITTVTQQITDTWQRIQNREFRTGCGKPDCEWCNFAKSNGLAVALHAEEEDDTTLDEF